MTNKDSLHADSVLKLKNARGETLIEVWSGVDLECVYKVQKSQNNYSRHYPKLKNKKVAENEWCDDVHCTFSEGENGVFARGEVDAARSPQFEAKCFGSHLYKWFTSHYSTHIYWISFA